MFGCPCHVWSLIFLYFLLSLIVLHCLFRMIKRLWGNEKQNSGELSRLQVAFFLSVCLLREWLKWLLYLSYAISSNFHKLVKTHFDQLSDPSILPPITANELFFLPLQITIPNHIKKNNRSTQCCSSKRTRYYFIPQWYGIQHNHHFYNELFQYSKSWNFTIW